jgi:NADP-dependent 3-hydroxy acid dehydrogenase YdfG
MGIVEVGMKVLAIGAAGKMGKAVAAYFAHEPGVEKLGLLDSQASALEAMAKATGADILQLHALDIEDTDELSGHAAVRRDRRHAAEPQTELQGDGGGHR